MLGKLARFVADRPGIVVSVISLILILSAMSAQNIKLTSGIGAMFSEDNEVYRMYKQYEKNFEISPSNIFIIIKSDDVLTREAFDLMLDIQERIKKLDGVANVISPASVLMQFQGHLPTNEAELKRLAETYAYQLIPKKTVALIVVSLATTDPDKQKAVAKQIEEIVKFTHKPTSFILEISGGATMKDQIESEITKSLKITMIVSIVLMILILYATFSGIVRKKITAFFPLIVSVTSVQVLYGSMPAIGIPISEHTNGALPMLIGLAIEYGAQLQNRYEEERKEGRGPSEAVVISITSTGFAITMALLTTVIGFMSMLTPGIPAMADFGIIASLGLIIAYVFTLTLLPAVLKIADRKDVEAKEIKSGILERSLEVLASFTSKRPLSILAIAAVVTATGMYCSQMVELETNYYKYIPKNLPALQKFEEIESMLGEQTVYTMILLTNEINVEKIREIRDFSEYVIKREDLIYNYDSIDKIVYSFTDKYGLRVDDNVVNFVLNSMPDEQKRFYISEDLVAIYFYSKANSYQEFKGLYESLVKDAKYYGIENFYVTGYPVLYSEMGKIMIEGQTIMTIWAYTFVILSLLIIYRSLRKAVIPLISISVVIGVMNLVMYFFGIKQTMLSIALNSITLGLGIDFSIHILERYFEERKKFDPISSVRRTIERTGKAIVTAALTMAGGFGSLMFSTFPIVQNFGFLALIAIILSLISALTIVPAFLIATENLKIISKNKLKNQICL